MLSLPDTLSRFSTDARGMLKKLERKQEDLLGVARKSLVAITGRAHQLSKIRRRRADELLSLLK